MSPLELVWSIFVLLKRGKKRVNYNINECYRDENVEKSNSLKTCGFQVPFLLCLLWFTAL